MSSELVGQVRQAPVSSVDRLLLMVLADNAGDSHRLSWLSLHDLCKATCMSRSQVRECLRRLERQHIIAIAPDSLVPPSFRRASNVSRVIRPIADWLTAEQAAERAGEQAAAACVGADPRVGLRSVN